MTTRRHQVIVDDNDRPLEDQAIHRGAYLYLKANLPPTMEPRRFAGSSRLVVSHLDNERYRVAWTQRNDWIAWFLRFERWQWLTTVEEEGGSRTKYDSLEVFNGPVAYLVQWIVGKHLKAGVRAMAEGLKRRAESLR